MSGFGGGSKTAVAVMSFVWTGRRCMDRAGGGWVVVRGPVTGADCGDQKETRRKGKGRVRVG